MQNAKKKEKKIDVYLHYTPQFSSVIIMHNFSF